MTDAEQALLGETARDALRALDEDELGNLLVRVRRAATRSSSSTVVRSAPRAHWADGCAAA
jgi:hypothetical protein